MDPFRYRHRLDFRFPKITTARAAIIGLILVLTLPSYLQNLIYISSLLFVAIAADIDYDGRIHYLIVKLEENKAIKRELERVLGDAKIRINELLVEKEDYHRQIINLHEQVAKLSGRFELVTLATFKAAIIQISKDFKNKVIVLSSPESWSEAWRRDTDSTEENARDREQQANRVLLKCLVQMHQENELMNDELQRLRNPKKSAQLQRMDQEFQENLKTQHNEILALRESLHDSQKEVDKLRKGKEAAEVSLINIENELTEVCNTSGSIREVQKLRNSLNSSATVIEELKKDLHVLRTALRGISLDKLQDLKKQKNTLDNFVLVLQKQLSDVQLRSSGEIQKLTQSIKTLECIAQDQDEYRMQNIEELSTVSDKLKTANKEMALWRKRFTESMQDPENAWKELGIEIESLEKVVEERDEEIMDLEEHIDWLKSGRARMINEALGEMQGAALEAELKKLKAKVKELQLECDKLRSDLELQT
jgi:chromosome segregation ATPase